MWGLIGRIPEGLPSRYSASEKKRNKALLVLIQSSIQDQISSDFQVSCVI